VHEHLTAVITGEKAEPFVGVIPLHLASGHEREPYAKRDSQCAAPDLGAASSGYRLPARLGDAKIRRAGPAAPGGSIATDGCAGTGGRPARQLNRRCFFHGSADCWRRGC
jgi:hypothetical protein